MSPWSEHQALSLNEWNELCKEYIYIYLRRSSKFNWINYSREKKGKKFLSNKIHPSAVHEPLSNTSPNVANLGHSRTSTEEERSYWNAANETDVHDVASWRGLAARKISLFLTGKQFCRGTADGLLFAESVIPVPRRDSNIERGTCLLDARRKKDEEEEEEGGGGGWSNEWNNESNEFSPLPENFSQLFSFDLRAYPFARGGWWSTPIIPPQASEKMFSGRENKKYIFFPSPLSNFTLQISRYLFA